MNAIMSYSFPSQRYERIYVLFIKMESDLKHVSPDAFHATHLRQKFDNHLKLSYNTPHFIAVIIALHLNKKLGCAAVHITLKHSTTTLKVKHCIE